MFIGLGLIWLPGYFLIEVWLASKQGKPWHSVFKENDEWGPDLDKHRKLCPSNRYKLSGNDPDNTGKENTAFA